MAMNQKVMWVAFLFIQILNIQKFIALGQKGFTIKFGNAQIVNITFLQLRIGLFMMTCFVHRWNGTSLVFAYLKKFEPNLVWTSNYDATCFHDNSLIFVEVQSSSWP